MKLFFTAFGLHNPFSAGLTQEHSVFPIAIETSEGLDLDYSSILVAEQFIIDSSAYEFVKERRRKHLAPMCKSLEVLEKEGLLDVKDFSEITKPHKDSVERKTDSLLEDIDAWISVARRQWAVLKPELEEFQKMHGDVSGGEFNRQHFGIVNYLAVRDKRIDEKESSRLHALLERPLRRLKSREKAEMKEVLRPLVAQILMNDLLRKALSTPFIDWDDTQVFYDRLQVAQWKELDPSNMPSLEIAAQARCLLKVVIPELCPRRIEDVVEFINNSRAVQSLRQELWSVLKEGKAVSNEWMVRILGEAAKADLRVEKRSRIIRWAGRLLGLVVPGAGAVGAVAETAIDVLVDAGETTTDVLVQRSGKARFEWYHALQRIQLSNERSGTK